jgi:NAD(P)-dependent dehydrogenase (short-subunit alcohol dehydrogenase family)
VARLLFEEKAMSQNLTIQQLLDLSGKVFLVAGGARNLGRDMASALAEAGADGVLTSRDEASAQATAHEIGAATGRRVLGLSLDAIDEGDVARVIAATMEQFGRLDVLVNCVGGGGGGAKGASTKLEERPREAWESLHEANLTAPFLLCKHVAPIMKQQGSGSIINIASIAGLIGRDRRVYPAGMPPQPIDYASAKAAVIGMTKDLAAYLGPDGVRVNAISPGGFERGQPPEFIAAYSDKAPLKRMGRDGVDLKGAVAFLASEASAYVTGHNLVVDGGFTIWQ